LGSGLAEVVIVELCRRFHGNLAVVAPGSPSRVDRGDPRVLAAELGATYILTGTLRRQANRLRVSVRLTRTADALVLWATTYELEAVDPLAIEGRLATAIADSLGPHLLPPERWASTVSSGLASARVTGELASSPAAATGSTAQSTVSRGRPPVQSPSE
jgi:TolB-like protein